MSDNKKNVAVSLTQDEFDQLKKLSATHNMEPEDFLKSLVSLFTDNKSLQETVASTDAKNNLEEKLDYISKLLIQKQHFIDLFLRSIYSTQLRLEGQFKKYRIEAAKELEKDFDRISIIVNDIGAKR